MTVLTTAPFTAGGDYNADGDNLDYPNVTSYDMNRSHERVSERRLFTGTVHRAHARHQRQREAAAVPAAGFLRSGSGGLQEHAPDRPAQPSRSASSSSTCSTTTTCISATICRAEASGRPSASSCRDGGSSAQNSRFSSERVGRVRRRALQPPYELRGRERPSRLPIRIVSRLAHIVQDQRLPLFRGVLRPSREALCRWDRRSS